MKKDFLIGAFILLIGCILLTGTKFQTVDEYYATHADVITERDDVVTLSIQAHVLAEHPTRIKKELRAYVPSDGFILKPKQYVLREGDTVFDIVQRATRQEKIQMEYQGANANVYKSAYIQGIQYIYEFAAGGQSGWMYQVNGHFPSVGVSKYTLSPNDRIDVMYTTDLGKDLGGKVE